jgi:isoquinoline 1-oxidoreductase beta subunit
MLTRRDFLKAGVLSLVVAVSPSGLVLVKAQDLKRHSPRIWINLSRDNYLTVLVNKSEMGQGVYTGIAQLVAEDLDFPWERVRVRSSPAGWKYVDPYMGIQLTGGSTSIRHMYEIMRASGAALREMILTAASKVWGVPRERLKAELGHVVDKETGRREPYGRFVEVALDLPVPEDPPLKSEEEFRYIGRSVPRVDLEDKVNGRARFGFDYFFENQIYAVIERPPSFGSRALSFDAGETLKVKGVTHVFKVGKGVAVCGENPQAVLKGRERLKVRWSPSPMEGMDQEKLRTYFLKQLKRKGLVARSDGDALGALRDSSKKLDLTYVLPYLYHACMEPMACTVKVDRDSCLIFAPTQNQTGVLNVARKVTGLPPSKIEVVTTYLGGGFGRKSNTEFVEEALRIAVRTRRPVKLFYTREDDVKAGWFRPMCAARVRGALDGNGRLSALHFKIAVPAVFEWAGRRGGGVDPASVSGVADTFYEIPNVHVEFVKVKLPVPVWFWRSVGHTHNAYIMETFIDQMAHLSGTDPVEFRLKLLSLNPRAYGVVEAVAERSGWHRGPVEGQSLGMAYHFSFGTHVAQVAEVSLEEGKVRVHRVVCVVDLGPLVVNPDLVVQQMESGIVMGLSAFLYEGVSFRRGGPENLNFDTYPILRLEETPEIEVHIVKSEGPMGGIGEPGVPPVAPAVANALFRITGRLVTELPYYKGIKYPS